MTCHRVGDRSLPQLELVQPLVFLFLVADVIPNHGFIATYG